MFSFPSAGMAPLALSAARLFSRAILLAGLTLPLSALADGRLTPPPAPTAKPSEIGDKIALDPALKRALAGMRYGLKPTDIDLYRQAFAAIDRSDWRGAAEFAARIEDRRLIGHVLAARYLSSDPQPAFADLRGWIDLYGDLPEADDIYDLAQSDRPDGVAAIPTPRGGRTSSHAPRDPDSIGSVEPRTSAGEQAFAKFFASDDKGALADATRAVAALGRQASTSLWVAGLAAWRMGQFPEAERRFAALAGSRTASGWMLAAGAYWAGRVEERDGLVAAASKWFNKASRYPTTFYGMLATRKLGLNLAQEIGGASVSAQHLDVLAETPAGYRAVALLEIGRRDLAARELERIDPAGNPKVEEALIVVADAAHLGDISRRLAQRIARPTDDASAHFPIPAWRPSGGFRIDPALVYAVARQESGFDPTAVSPAGAAGLMQIMPDTADALAPNRQRSLFDPSTNLDVGQRYLGALMQNPDIGENLLLLAVAYNGGSGNPAKFRHILKHADPLLAIESMPGDQTRAFIERVLANYWIYRARLGGDTSSLTDLADGRWPLYRWGADDRGDVVPAAFAFGLQK